METEKKLHLTPEQRNELERQLRCIDHFASHAALPAQPVTENVAATVTALASLEGDTASGESPNGTRDYTMRCTNVLQDILSGNVPGQVDEARILTLYKLLYDEERSNDNRRRMFDRLLSGGRLVRERQHTVISNELRTLVEWLSSHTANNRQHPLLTAGIFVYEFLAIHPFNEGKCTMAHLLAMQYVYNKGHQWISTYSPVRTLAASPVKYHSALNAGLQDRYTPQEDITEWILFWTQSIYHAMQQASELFAPAVPDQSVARRPYLNGRQHRILAYIEKNQPVKVGDIATYMHKVSINTIKKDLLRLRMAGYITTEGVLKGTVYYRN